MWYNNIRKGVDNLNIYDTIRGHPVVRLSGHKSLSFLLDLKKLCYLNLKDKKKDFLKACNEKGISCLIKDDSSLIADVNGCEVIIDSNGDIIINGEQIDKYESQYFFDWTKKST